MVNHFIDTSSGVFVLSLQELKCLLFTKACADVIVWREKRACIDPFGKTHARKRKFRAEQTGCLNNEYEHGKEHQM